MKNVKNILTFSVFSFVIIALSLMFVLSPDGKVSKSERRSLKSFEEVLTAENPFGEFESYFLDQFPLRDSFRTIKAVVNTDFLKKNDNNKIYKHNGSIIKIEDKLDEKQTNITINLINSVIEKFFKEHDVYYSVIPDKHYYASKENSYPAMDYEKMLSMLSENVNAQYIDIIDKLSLSDYYTTDSHWSQEKITDVAQALVDGMSPDEITLVPDGEGFKVNKLEPFYGVYYGQSALSAAPDKIYYLTSENTDSMKMTVINDKGYPQTHSVYTLDKFNNVDPYDVFTAGAQPFITIENPKAKSGKHLVLFRDSFGSSIAPIFAEGYSKVTMVDLRYMFPDALSMMLGRVEKDADVLFLYSTGLINGGGTLRGFMSEK